MKRVLFLFVLLIILCVPGFSGGQDDEDAVSPAAAAGAKEAPALTAMVNGGSLPALEDRLPSNPLVESGPSREIGVHGGVMRKVWRGAGKDKWGVTKMMEEYLIRYENGEIVPNAAESVEVLDNSTRFVFKLREGMKWSDGVPFTANDVLFYWEEVLLKKVTGKSAHVSVRDAEVNLIDDYTFEIIFPTPRHLFLIDFMSAREFFTPAHYAKTILPDFIGADKAGEMAEAQGFSDAQAMVQQKLYYFWLYPDVPKITAWLPMNDVNDNIYKLTRNPYYWKTDTAGKQLPYIDEIHYYRVEDTPAYTLKAIAGELDFQFRSVQFEDFTLLKENESRGDYRVAIWKSVENNTLQFNPTVEDPVLAELYQDSRFRKAVSSAIDREEILEITNSMAVAKQAAFMEGSPLYRESWARAAADYDPAAGNALLDDIGLPWDSRKKYRLRSDGEVLEIIFMHRRNTQADLAMIELIAAYLEELGLKIVVRQLDRTYLEELRDTNQLSMTIGIFQELDLLIDNKGYVPTRDEEVHWGRFGKYVESGGSDGTPPVGDYALLVEYWDRLNETPAGPEQDEWAEKIVDIHEKNIFMIGVMSSMPKIAIVNKDMRNVPDGILDADILRTPGNAKPWIFFYGG